MRWAAFGCCVAVVAALLAAGPRTTNGAPAPRAPSVAVVTRLLRDLRIAGPGPGRIRSLNWSGYADTRATFWGVKGNWVEPQATCDSSTSLAAFWVGLDGYSNQTVEQDGSMVICAGGLPFHYVWWEMYPDRNAHVYAKRINAGDNISASVTFSPSSDAYTLRLVDAQDPGADFATEQTGGHYCPCARSSAEWIAEAPMGRRHLFPLADFGTVHFDGSVAARNSRYQSVGAFDDSRITMEGPADVKARTAPLDGSDFAVKWEHAT